jgi:hypothetical protein
LREFAAALHLVDRRVVQRHDLVAIKGRLLRIKFAKVNGVSVDVPQPARPMEHEDVPF